MKWRKNLLGLSSALLCVRPLPYVRPPRLHTTCLWAPVALSLSFRHASPVLHPNPNVAATPDALHRAPTATATPDARSPAFLPQPRTSPVHRRRPLPSSPSAHRHSQIVSSLHHAAPLASDGRIRRRARSWPCRCGRMHARYRAAITGSRATQVCLGTPGSIQASGLDHAHHFFPNPPHRLCLFRHAHNKLLGGI
jgi:hypothetical protein